MNLHSIENLSVAAVNHPPPPASSVRVRARFCHRYSSSLIWGVFKRGTDDMVLESPPTVSRKFRDIIFIPILIGTTIWAILLALYTWIILLRDNLPFVVFLGLLAVGGTSWGYYSTTIVADVYFLWECKIIPQWENYWEAFFEAMVQLWNVGVCWWNAFSETQRLLSGKLLWNVYEGGCDNGFKVWTMLYDVIVSFIYLISTYLQWSFVGNPIDSVLPLYPWYKFTVVIIVDLGLMIDCACESLYIFTTVMSRVIQSNNLSCALHQLSNIPIDVIATMVKFALQMIQLIFYTIAHHLTPTFIADVLSGGVPTSPVEVQLPDFIAAAERGAVGSYYVGEFLNDALQTLICTNGAEVNSTGNKTLGVELYLQCMADNSTRLDLFCFIGPVMGSIFRFEILTLQLFLNSGRILRELHDQPPGPWFLTDDWQVGRLYDTFRYPPPGYGYCDNPNEPVFIPGSNTSAIVPPQPLLYGNYSSPSAISCSYYNVSRTIIPCSNCSEVEQYDLVQCLCRTSYDLDTFLAGIVPYKIFQGTLCCLVGRTIRIMTALLKFTQGLICHIIMLPRFGQFITDQNNFDLVFNEFMGQYYEIGGILTCPAIILEGFNPDLTCLGTVVVNLIKPLGETFRLVVDIPVRALNNVFSTGCVGIFQVVCTSNETTCWDLDVRIYNYLRKPRDDVVSIYEYDNDTLYTLPDYRDLYLPINQSYPTAWIDCFCELVSFDFLNQFLNHPSSFLPDLCCGLEYAFRFLVEIINFLSETMFSAFETFSNFFEPGASIDVTVLAYLSCYTEFNCAPIPQMLSDVADFMNCPCVIVYALNQGIDPNKESFPCICEFFSAIGNFTYHSISAASLGAQVTVQVLDCVVNADPPFSALPFCSTYLSDRVSQYFLDIKLALDDICSFIGSIGCSLGLLFQAGFGDCIGTKYYSPPDYPTCSGGSEYGICAPSDRFSILFDRSCLVLIAIPGFITRIIESFAITAFGQAFDGFSNLSNLVYQLLIAFGDPFFGTPAFTTTNGTQVPATTGFLQALGITINCLAGPPPPSQCINEVAPSAGGGCIGDILVVLGNTLAEIWSDASLIFASFVGIIGDFLSGNTQQLGTDIANFVNGLLQLAANIFGGLTNLANAIIAAIVGVIDFFFGDGVGAIVQFVLDLTTFVGKTLLRIIDAALANYHPSGKRYGGGGGASDGSFVYEASETWKADTEETLTEFLRYTFAKHFSSKYDDIRNHRGGVEKRSEDDGEDGDNATTPSYGGFTSYTDFQQKVQVMYDSMTGLCRSVMKGFIDSGYVHEDQLPNVEVPLWYGCYMAYIVPLGLNSLSSDSNGTAKDFSDGGNLIPTVVEDILYNYTSFMGVVTDVAGTLALYADWVGKFNDLTGDSADIVSFENLYFEVATEDDGEDGEDAGLKRTTTTTSSANSLFVNGSYLTDGFSYLDLEGSNTPTLTVNGRYPVYLSNMTFAEYQAYKGYTSVTSQHFGSILTSYSKGSRENTILSLHSTFTHLFNTYGVSSESYESSSDYYGWMKKRELLPTVEANRRRRSSGGDTEREGSLSKFMNFPFRNYFFNTVPATLWSLLGRLRGTEDVKEILFEHYLKRKYDNDDLILSDALSSKAENRKRFRDNVNGSDLNDLRKEYDRLTSNMPASPSYKKYDNEESYSSYKRFVEDYGDAMNLTSATTKRTTGAASNDTETEEQKIRPPDIFSHRWGMAKRAYQGAVDHVLSALSLETLGKNFRETSFERYANMYSDGIRMRNRESTIRSTYATFRKYYLRFREKWPKEPLPPCGEGDVTCVEIRHRYDEMLTTVDDFLMYGHYAYDDDYDPRDILSFQEEEEEDNNNRSRKKKKKRQAEMEVAEPLIPLCYPLKSLLNCQFCDQCPEDECYDCKQCNNCTTFANGNTFCSECNTCSVGGPLCTGGCGTCTVCENTGTCLNCIILDLFFSMLIDRCEYCAALARGDYSVVKHPPPNSTLIKIFYFSDTLNTCTTNVSQIPPANPGAGCICDNPIADFVICDVIAKITNVDIFTTSVYFIENLNVNPFNVTFPWVGAWFWIEYKIGPFPWVRQCNWDIDLQCVFGTGFRDALWISAIVILVLGVISWIVFPPAAGIISFFVAGGWFSFYWSLVLSIGWFYPHFCYVSVSTFFYSYVSWLFLGVPILPLLPACAANQTFDVLNSTFAPCAITIPQSLVVNGTSTCPTCPTKVMLYSPQMEGFTNPFVEIGYVLQRYAPGVNNFFNNTCLVRGGCFWGLMNHIGPLYPFFSETFNITYFSNGSITPQTATLDSLWLLQLPTLLAFPAIVLLFYLGAILLGAVLIIVWAFLLRWFSLWPWYNMVPYPISNYMKLYPSYFVGGGGPGTGSAEGKYHPAPFPPGTPPQPPINQFQPSGAADSAGATGTIDGRFPSSNDVGDAAMPYSKFRAPELQMTEGAYAEFVKDVREIRKEKEARERKILKVQQKVAKSRHRIIAENALASQATATYYAEYAIEGLFRFISSTVDYFRGTPASAIVDANGGDDDDDDDDNTDDNYNDDDGDGKDKDKGYRKPKARTTRLQGGGSGGGGGGRMRGGGGRRREESKKSK